MTMSLAGQRATAVRVLAPWRGSWQADVSFDPLPAGLPSGRVELVVGETHLACTVDPSASGRFGEVAQARVVGGRGGWTQTVKARHFHSDGGVLSSTVFAATAAEIGESVTDMAPVRLGVDYVRQEGPASRVLGDRDWFVDAAGQTIVGQRPEFAAPTTAVVLAYDPRERRAEIATGAELVMPGMVFTAERFGSFIVRDVEQSFSAEGARAIAWCAKSQATRLMEAMAAMVRETARVASLKTYRYRVVSQAADGRLSLQAVVPSAGVPDAVTISMWPGMPGLTAELAPGAHVLLDFVNGDESQPVVRSFHDEQPIAFDLAAKAKASLTAPLIELDGQIVRLSDSGALPTARVGDLVNIPVTGIPGLPSGGVIATGSPKVLA